MIQLTRLNNSVLMVNSDLIKFVEQAPDTVITLINGEKILVRESSAEVTARVISFRRAVLQGLFQVPGPCIPFSEFAPAPTSAKDPVER